NRYDLHVAPTDLARFGDYTASLVRQVGEYLTDYARERGLQPVADIQVHVTEDGALRSGSVRAEARFVDLSVDVHREVEEASAGTRKLRLADLAAARREGA